MFQLPGGEQIQQGSGPSTFGDFDGVTLTAGGLVEAHGQGEEILMRFREAALHEVPGDEAGLELFNGLGGSFDVAQWRRRSGRGVHSPIARA